MQVSTCVFTLTFTAESGIRYDWCCKDDVDTDCTYAVLGFNLDKSMLLKSADGWGFALVR